MPEDLRAPGSLWGCESAQALLPSFVLARRVDVVETVGGVLVNVVTGARGVRPAARRAGVPHSTARSWVRRFAERARDISVAFAALAVELGGEALVPLTDPRAWALGAIETAFAAAAALPGWLGLGCWRFVSTVGGGGCWRPTQPRPICEWADGVSCLGCPQPPRRMETQMTPEHAQAVALHRWGVIAEAANARLDPPARGAAVRQAATRAHAYPDGTDRRYSRATIDRWLRAWRAGGLAALEPSPRSDNGAVRAHPELADEAAALRLELPTRSAAQIASILFHRHGITVAERTVRAQLRRRGLHREALDHRRAGGALGALAPGRRLGAGPVLPHRR